MRALEGEKRPTFLDLLDRELPARQGIYSVYDKKGRLYYSRKASDPARRLNQHLRDRHGETWDTLTLFHVQDGANVAELEVAERRCRSSYRHRSPSQFGSRPTM